AVEAVFLKALAVSPGDRFPSMGRFWAALHHAVLPESPGAAPGLMPSMSGLSTPIPGRPSAPMSAPYAPTAPSGPGYPYPSLPGVPSLRSGPQGMPGGAYSPPSAPYAAGSMSGGYTPLPIPTGETHAAGVSTTAGAAAPARTSRALMALGGLALVL